MICLAYSFLVKSANSEYLNKYFYNVVCNLQFTIIHRTVKNLDNKAISVTSFENRRTQVFSLHSPRCLISLLIVCDDKTLSNFFKLEIRVSQNLPKLGRGP